MRTLTATPHRIIILAAVLCLAALPAWAQLNGYYHPASFTEGNLFFYGPAEGDGFAHAVAAGDFNGDGADDLATGIPGDENAGASYQDSGIVIIRYGALEMGLKGGSATTVISQMNGGSPDPAETYDQLGFSLAAGDFNGDGYDDLAIGALLDDGEGPPSGGSVQVHYGSATGLQLGGAQFFHQGSPGISGSSELFDYFGYALAVGNFDGDAYADLAIGSPGETYPWPPATYAYGRVVALYGSAAGLSASRSQTFDQDIAGMDGSSEDYDFFGAALAAGDFNGDGRDDLAVGVLGENDGGGGVHFILGSPTGLTVTGNNLWTQDDAGVLDVNEADDNFGAALAAADFNLDGFDDVAIGVPGEDVDPGGVTDAGAIHIFFGSASGISSANSRMWTSGGTGLGASETSDFWGWSLAAGDFDADGNPDLAVGAPGESFGSLTDVGEVTILRGYPYGVTGWYGQVWNQDSSGIPNANEDGDQFGRALAAGDFDGDGHSDLVIGTPVESTVAAHDGAEWVLYSGGIFADGFESGDTTQWQATQSSTFKNSNRVWAATGAQLGPAWSQYGLQVFLFNGANNPVYVMAGPARGFVNERTLKGTFFIDPQSLTMSTTPGANSFQMMTFTDGVGAGSKTRLAFNLGRVASGYVIDVFHWNDTIANFQYSGGGFLVAAGDSNGHNTRVDFEWTAGNPGHLTMWRTRYVSGAPDASGRVQMFTANLPGMQSAVINYFYAGMTLGPGAGTYGSFYLDEFSFRR